MKTRSGMRLALLAFTLTLAAAVAPAQQPLLVAHVDLDAFNQGFAGSGLEQFWNDPAMRQWRTQNLDPLLGQAGQQGGVPLDPVLRNLRGQLGIVVTVEPPPAGQYGEVYHFAFGLSQPGQLDTTLSEMAAAMGPQGQQQIDQMIVREGDIAVFADEPSLGQQMLQRLAGGASGLGLEARPGAVATAMLHMQPILTGSTISASDREDMTAAGIMSLYGIGLSVGFGGGSIVSDLTVEFSGQPQGVFTLLGSPRPFSAVNVIPADSIGAVGLQTVPPPQIYDWIESMVRSQSSPNDQQDFQNGVNEFRTATGLDLRTQVFGAFTGELALAFGGMTGPAIDAALFAGVSDQATVERLIEFLLQIASQQQPSSPTGEPAPPLAPVAMTAGSWPYRMLTVPGLPFPLCWGFAGGHLVVGTSANQMMAVANTQTSGGLTSSPGFQRVASQMSPSCSAFVYTDRQRLVQLGLSAASGGLSFMGIVPQQVSSVLAQFQALVPRLGHQGATLVPESTRFTLHSVNTSGGEYLLGPMLAVSMQAPPPSAPPPASTSTPPAAWGTTTP